MCSGWKSELGVGDWLMVLTSQASRSTFVVIQWKRRGRGDGIRSLQAFAWIVQFWTGFGKTSPCTYTTASVGNTGWDWEKFSWDGRVTEVLLKVLACWTPTGLHDAILWQVWEGCVESRGAVCTVPSTEVYVTSNCTYVIQPVRIPKTLLLRLSHFGSTRIVIYQLWRKA